MPQDKGYSREELFAQAGEDHSAYRHKTNEHDSYLSYGIKIVRDNRTHAVTILDTTKSEYYEEISDGDYYLFEIAGWFYGIYTLSLANFSGRVEHLNEEIKREVNNSRRKRVLTALREEREEMLKNYYKVNQLLIKLNKNE